MQINEIRELALLMNSQGLSDIELKIPGMEIKLKKSGNTVQVASMPCIEPLNIEQINPNDSDYKLIEKARSNRANGEKVHSLDEVMKEFNAN